MQESEEVKEFKRNAKFQNVGGVSCWQRFGIPKELQRKADLRNAQKPKNKKRRHAKQKRQQIEFELCEKRTREYLKEFWRLFHADSMKESRLGLLKRAANPGWARVSGKMRSRCRRDKYHRMSILFGNLGKVECGACAEKLAKEKHHIVPCCYGGPTIVENLIMICLDCHNEIHPWLFSQEQK